MSILKNNPTLRFPTRLLSYPVLFVSVFMFPWWLTLLLLLIAALYFPLFLEGLVVATLLDVLYYGGELTSLSDILFTVVTVLALLVRIVLRPYLRLDL